jgi:uncharacterized protein (DUF2132 family)
MNTKNITPQKNNPLHGVSLESILEALVEKHGFTKLASMIKIKCFSDKPSIKSSLTFLRKTPWAREKVEKLYLSGMKRK